MERDGRCVAAVVTSSHRCCLLRPAVLHPAILYGQLSDRRGVWASVRRQSVRAMLVMTICSVGKTASVVGAKCVGRPFLLGLASSCQTVVASPSPDRRPPSCDARIAQIADLAAASMQSPSQSASTRRPGLRRSRAKRSARSVGRRSDGDEAVAGPSRARRRSADLRLDAARSPPAAVAVAGVLRSIEHPIGNIWLVGEGVTSPEQQPFAAVQSRGASGKSRKAKSMVTAFCGRCSAHRSAPGR